MTKIDRGQKCVVTPKLLQSADWYSGKSMKQKNIFEEINGWKVLHLCVRYKIIDLSSSVEHLNSVNL